MSFLADPADLNRAELARRLRPVVEQYARRMWWGQSAYESAASVVTQVACSANERHQFGLPGEVIADVAMGALQQTYDAHGVHHGRFREQAGRMVMAQLQHGATRRECGEAMVDLARAQSLLPPPWMLAEILEEAATEHRRVTAWWRRREGGV